MGRSRGIVNPNILAVSTSSRAAIPTRGRDGEGRDCFDRHLHQGEGIAPDQRQCRQKPDFQGKMICALSPLETSDVVAALSLLIVWPESDVIPRSSPISATRGSPAGIRLPAWQRFRTLIGRRATGRDLQAIVPSTVSSSRACARRASTAVRCAPCAPKPSRSTRRRRPRSGQDSAPVFAVGRKQRRDRQRGGARRRR